MGKCRLDMETKRLFLGRINTVIKYKIMNIKFQKKAERYWKSPNFETNNEIPPNKEAKRRHRRNSDKPSHLWKLQQ